MLGLVAIWNKNERQTVGNIGKVLSWQTINFRSKLQGKLCYKYVIIISKYHLNDYDSLTSLVKWCKDSEIYN